MRNAYHTPRVHRRSVRAHSAASSSSHRRLSISSSRLTRSSMGSDAGLCVCACVCVCVPPTFPLEPLVTPDMPALFVISPSRPLCVYVVDVVVPVDADLGTSSAEGLYPGATRWSASRLRPISLVSKSTEHNVSCIVIPSLIARRQTTCSEDSAGGYCTHSLCSSSTSRWWSICALRARRWAIASCGEGCRERTCVSSVKGYTNCTDERWCYVPGAGSRT